MYEEQDFPQEEFKAKDGWPGRDTSYTFLTPLGLALHVLSIEHSRARRDFAVSTTPYCCPPDPIHNSRILNPLHLARDGRAGNGCRFFKIGMHRFASKFVTTLPPQAQVHSVVSSCPTQSSNVDAQPHGHAQPVRL
eukprot:scaffold50767_cov51-Phaeocystis_antarctica.AAC.2